SNASALFKNKFSKDTRPNTLTNTGANSLITFSDFSDISNRMSFKLVFGDSVIKPIFSISLNDIPKVKDLSSFEKVNSSEFILRTDSSLIILSDSGYLVNSYDFITAVKPAVDVINNTDYLVQPVDSIVYVIMQGGASTNYIRPGEIVTTSPLIIKTLTEADRIIFGTDAGKVFVFSTGSPNEEPTLLNSITMDTSLIIIKIAGDNLFFSFIAESKTASSPPTPFNLFFDNSGNSFSFVGESPIDLALTKDKEGNYISVVLTNKNKFYILSENELVNSFKIESGFEINSFSLIDLRKDGNIYITFNNGSRLEARNFDGALADNYPVSNPEGKNFVLTPLAMDFEGDDRTELFTFTEDGRIFAFDGPSGRLVNGFPLSAGANPSAVPVLYSERGLPSIALIDENNFFAAWNVGMVEGDFYWREKNGNNLNTSFSAGAESEFAVNEFFPKNRAYNYPNPVYDGQTFIRYYVSEDSKINIKIFDLAGGYVSELSDDAQGGMDNETVWNVTDIQSGVYLARIEAVSSTGKSESQVIKIAVVK
ncbi:MAG: T9SS type A sorting domain-containing protein, partial [Ignavibacteriaceae bacterium]